MAMETTELEVLKAASSLHQDGSWTAEDLFRYLDRADLPVAEVSLALLHLRDEGLVVTEPTVGDPLDGHFAFRLSQEGLNAAAQL